MEVLQNAEQDVYETIEEHDISSDPISSLNSDDDHDFGGAEDGTEIVRERILLSSALNYFANSTAVDAKYSDFSDKIKPRNQGATSYYRRLPDRQEYMIRGSADEKETSLQKLRRLMFEVEELELEISTKKSTARNPNDTSTTNVSGEVIGQTASGKDKVVTYSQMADQVTILQNELLKLAQSLGHNPDLPIDDAIEGGGTIIKQMEVGKSLMNQLRAFKNASVISGTADDVKTTNTPSITNKSSDKSDVVTYELFYTPESAKFTALTKLADVESRVNSLERLLGTHFLQNVDSATDSIAAIIQSSGSLVGAVERLDHHLSLLTQPRSLESVMKRVKLVIPDLERLAELRKKFFHDIRPLSTALEESSSKTEPTDTERRIDYLFELLDKLDTVGSVVPHLLGRMHALRSLHNEAAGFAESLKNLGQEQLRIGESSKAVENGMNQLSLTIEENKTRVIQNVESIEKRISDLAKRLDKIVQEKG